MPEDLVKEIEGFLTRGGRLVITFFPETSRHSRILELDEEEPNEREKRIV